LGKCASNRKNSLQKGENNILGVFYMRGLLLHLLLHGVLHIGDFVPNPATIRQTAQKSKGPEKPVI
jgi:hypothetical protein